MTLQRINTKFTQSKTSSDKDIRVPQPSAKMRSRPYARPPPLPPIFDELAAVLPFPKPAYRSRDDADIPLDTLDHDTSQLIPTKQRTHRVWVQGQLVDVRTVSTTTRSKSTSGYDRGVSGSRRRRSLDDTANFDHEEDRETVLRTKQLRGYGIGGVGNIRESRCHQL